MKIVQTSAKGAIFVCVWKAKMIPLFFVVVCAEGLVAFLLMVKIGPLREWVMKGSHQVKLKRGTVLTVAGTIFVILLSDLYSILKIQNKGTKHGAMTPMDQVIGRTILLQATLIGFAQFRGFLIDRMEHYMRKLMKLRSSGGALREEVEREKVQVKEKEEKAGAEVKQLRKEISGLKESLKKLEMETAEKDSKMETAEAHVVARGCPAGMRPCVGR